MNVPPTPISGEWYRESFNAFYPVLYAHRSIEAAAPEAAFAARCLRLLPGERVLDLCCGNGRHLFHLRGHTDDVLGIDYSVPLLALARQTLGPDARLVRADMRALPFPPAFHAVTNFFTSFGYFDRLEDNRRALGELARVLYPGGRFLIDHVNARAVARTLVPESVREYKGYVIRERRWIDDARHRMNKTIDVARNGAAVGSWGESVQLFHPDELEALLRREGLCVDHMFGDYEGMPLHPSRPRMIVAGHRGESP